MGMKRLALALILAVVAVGCAPGSMGPVLSTVEAVGKGVSKLLGWCEEHDVSIEDVLKAKKALEEKNYVEAAAIAAELVQKIGENEDVPEEIAILAGLIRGAAAAQVIDESMSAISAPQRGVSATPQSRSLGPKPR